MVRPRFDQTQPLVAARAFLYLGHQYQAGDAFPVEGIDPIPAFKLRTLYGSRVVNHGKGKIAERDDSPVTVTQTAPSSSWFDVDAPWLESPERIQGRGKAEARAAELREAGEPDYHHGVRLEEGENGWWSVQADWMGDNAYNAHGEGEARELAAKLRTEGPPPDPRTEVTVEPGLVMGEAEGQFVVNAPWLEEAIVVSTREAAEAEAAALKTAGPPEGWEPAPPPAG